MHLRTLPGPSNLGPLQCYCGPALASIRILPKFAVILSGLNGSAMLGVGAGVSKLGDNTLERVSQGAA